MREAIHRVDGANVMLRWTDIIQRREYRVAGPNSLWHIDGHHKLIRWKFVTHGGIDGYSRLIVFLQCNTNNRAATVFKNFIKAVHKFGSPSRVRGDKGRENNQVSAWMEQQKGQNRGSFIAGPSVHNQRIERLWRDVHNTVGKLYADLFRNMEHNNWLDVSNSVNMYCLHYVFKP